MRTLHVLSALGFIVGVALIMLAPRPDAPVASLFDHPGTMLLFAGFFMFGLSHGLVEGVINPLIATIYSDQKTKKIIAVHAWWPAGLIIGGLLALGIDDALQRQLAGATLADSDSRGGLSAAGAVASVSADRARDVERVDGGDVEAGNSAAVPRAVRVHVDDRCRRDRARSMVSDGSWARSCRSSARRPAAACCSSSTPRA